jgi:hypothetical protein
MKTNLPILKFFLILLSLGGCGDAPSDPVAADEVTTTPLRVSKPKIATASNDLSIPGELTVGGDVIVQGVVMASGFIDTVNTDGARLPQGFQAGDDSVINGRLFLNGELFFNGGVFLRSKMGPDLADADQTLQPAVDKASEYTQVELTADRTKTFGVTGVVPGTRVRIILAASNYSITIANGGPAGGQLFTFGQGRTENQAASFRYDGTNWVFVDFEYLES